MVKSRVLVSPLALTRTPYFPGGDAGPRCGCAAHMIMPGKDDGAFLPQIPREAVHALARRRRAVAAPTPKPPPPAAAGTAAAGPSAVPVKVRSTLPAAIHELDLHLVGILAEVIVDGDVVVAPAQRIVRLEHVQRAGRDVAGRLAQHVDVVEDVEAAPVRADDQVALLGRRCRAPASPAGSAAATATTRRR